MALMKFGMGYLLFTALHICCFAFALAVCGLYGTDVQRANEQNKYVDGKWVFAIVVAALSAVTCIVWFVPPMLRVAHIVAPAWNFILFVLWIAVFGVFGDMYIKEDAEGDGGIERMKNAVWIDLVNALLWLVATIAALGYWWKHRETRTRFTGRAKV